MSRNTSNIANAILARLASDAALLALCPNGVYWDQAPPGATRFVIVSLVTAEDVDTYGGTAYEDALYSVDARMLRTSGAQGGDINAAAVRIDELLHDVPLAAAGYTWMATYRETPIHEIEPDADPGIAWDRRGGSYRVQMALGLSTRAVGGPRKLGYLATPTPRPPGPTEQPVDVWACDVPPLTLATDGDVLTVLAWGAFTAGTPIPGGDWYRKAYIFFGNVGDEIQLAFVERLSTQPYDLYWLLQGTIIRAGRNAQAALGRGSTHGGTVQIKVPPVVADLNAPSRVRIAAQLDAPFTDAGVVVYGALVTTG